MTDHKYTDEEVIRALECCANTLKCRNCPLFAEDGCAYMNINYALDLINRQRAEIERLQEECDQAWEEHSDIQIKYDLLFDEAKALIEKTKSEAVKEFAERLETALLVGGIYPVIVKNTIHRLVKEMTRSCPDCKHFVGCETACGGEPCDSFE